MENMARKVRITVLKTDFNAEFAAKYGVANMASGCPQFKVGDIVECERHRQPKSFCGEAWKCIQHYVYALYYGGTIPFGKDWMREPGICIATCNDGLRPVTFKLEVIES